MNVLDKLRHLIDQQETGIHQGVPADREEAILAIVRVLDRSPPTSEREPFGWLGLVDAQRLPDLGANRAMQLCLETVTVGDGDAGAAKNPSGTVVDGWGERILQECGSLAEAEMVLALAEADFLRIVDDGNADGNGAGSGAGNGVLDAWIARKGTPPSWRERRDIEWWASLLANQNDPELRALRLSGPNSTRNDDDSAVYYLRLATVYLEMMAYHLGYPLDTVIGGCPIRIYCAVLGQIIAWALQARDRREVITSRSERSLLAELTASIAVDPTLIGQAMTAFTMDRENAAYHSAVPGIATAPLIRVAPDRIVWSIHGLTTQPILFMLRELRRCDSHDYHNTAYLRETVFRQDLYVLFPDKRFVESSGRIELRRTDGGIRTDNDAVIFDRKTGTMATFELKSQDPFARSTAELVRRRDNVLYANRQVSAMLDWLKRFDADEILNRVDHRTAKTFRVQRVLPFVLARFIANFGDDPTPDHRAAWGSWPQFLRHAHELPSDANPLSSLSTRLMSDSRTILETSDGPSREIMIGNTRLVVHSSYAAYRAHSFSAH